MVTITSFDLAYLANAEVRNQDAVAADTRRQLVMRIPVSEGSRTVDDWTRLSTDGTSYEVTLGPLRWVDWDRLRTMATALVMRWAPDAPEAVLNEAVIRTAGYVVQRPAAGSERQIEGDSGVDTGERVRYGISHDVLRLCGATDLLAPWRVRAFQFQGT